MACQVAINSKPGEESSRKEGKGRKERKGRKDRSESPPRRTHLCQLSQEARNGIFRSLLRFLRCFPSLAHSPPPFFLTPPCLQVMRMSSVCSRCWRCWFWWWLCLERPSWQICVYLWTFSVPTLNELLAKGQQDPSYWAVKASSLHLPFQSVALLEALSPQKALFLGRQVIKRNSYLVVDFHHLIFVLASFTVSDKKSCWSFGVFPFNIFPGQLDCFGQKKLLKF